MSSTAIRQEVLSIGKYSSIYVLGQAFSRAVGFFMIPLYTHYLSPTNYGELDLVEILTAIVALLIAMGAGDTMSRFYYRENDPQARRTVVSTVLLGFAVFGVPVLIAAFALVGLLARSVLAGDTSRLALELGFLTCWVSLPCDIGLSYLRMRYMAKTFVAVSIAQLASLLAMNVYFIVFLGWDISGILLSSLITQTAIALVLSVAILARVGLRVSPRLLWRMMAFGLPLVPAQITWMAAFAFNRLFLRWLASPDPAAALAMVGLYSLGHKFAVVIQRFIISPFNSFWGPRRLELLARGGPEARRTIARICTYAMFVTAWAALGLAVGVESVIAMMADPRYIGAHRVVPYIALAYVSLALEPHLTTGILHRGKTIWITAASVVSLVVSLAWNWEMIPRYGLVGAATSTMVAMMVREALIYVVAQRIDPIPFELGRLLLLLAVGVAMYAACAMIRLASPLATLAARESLAACYPLALALVGFDYDEEIGWFTRRLRGQETVQLAETAAFATQRARTL